MIYGNSITTRTNGHGSLEAILPVKAVIMYKKEFHMQIMFQDHDMEDACGKQQMVLFGYLEGMENLLMV
jgi:hypothetical protein